MPPMDSTVIGFIIAAIKKQVEPPKDLYDKLLSLVEKVTEVNTQMIANQEEILKINRDETVPALENIAESYEELSSTISGLKKSIDDHYNNPFYKKLWKDLNELLSGEGYDMMKLIKKVNKFVNFASISFGILIVYNVLKGIGFIEFLKIKFFKGG